MTRLLPLALALAVAGCSGEVGTSKTVAKETIEKQAQTQFDKLARQRGQERFPPIECPDDLEDPKVGDTTRCEATASDGTLGITVEVTAVDDDGVKLSFQGDDKLQK